MCCLCTCHACVVQIRCAVVSACQSANDAKSACYNLPMLKVFLYRNRKSQVSRMHGPCAWQLMRLFDPFLICCISSAEVCKMLAGCLCKARQIQLLHYCMLLAQRQKSEDAAGCQCGVCQPIAQVPAGHITYLNASGKEVWLSVRSLVWPSFIKPAMLS